MLPFPCTLAKSKSKPHCPDSRLSVIYLTQEGKESALVDSSAAKLGKKVFFFFMSVKDMIPIGGPSQGRFFQAAGGTL